MAITSEEEKNEIHMLDYLIILAKNKKLILSITLAVAIITSAISIFSSVKFYVAETSIFLTDQKEVSMANQLISQFGMFSGGNSSNVYNNQKLFVEIIKSRTFLDTLIERFKLLENHKTKNIKETRKMLLKHIIIEPDFTKKNALSKTSNQSPLMRIYAKDQNPQKAADLANAIVEELIVFVNNISSSKAAKSRVFFENQLKKSTDSLSRSEEDLKAFQEKTGIFEIGKKMNITINKYTPAMLLEYNRLFRQLKFNETLNGIIIKQYEAAKLDEAKNSTSIQVIDKASPPKKPSSIRRWGGRKALMTTVLAFLLSCFWVISRKLQEQIFKHSPKSKTLLEYLSFKRKI